MRFKFWPRTLRAQLILVVAGAVAISNIAVAFYFYKQSEAQARNFSDERMIDRTAAVAATVSQVTPQSRLVVMRTMGRLELRFREAPAGDFTKAPTPQGKVPAQTLAAT